VTNNLEWTTDNIHDLGRKFMQSLIENMRGDKGAIVQLGQSGEGIQPNYQITYSNGVRRIISGSSHSNFKKNNMKNEKFNPENISVGFSLDQIVVPR